MKHETNEVYDVIYIICRVLDMFLEENKKKLYILLYCLLINNCIFLLYLWIRFDFMDLLNNI